MTTDDSRERRWAAAYSERPRLLRIARRRTASDAEAEDCVSEAMVRAVEFEGLDEGRMAAFLTTVTLRLCADQHRGRARLARVGGQLVGTTEEPSPEDRICDQAEAQWLVESLRGMSAHQRRVVAARAEGLSLDDVARRLGVSVDAVKSAVARVRGTARAALAKTLGVTPVARWASVLGRRNGHEMTAVGTLASVVVGVTLGGGFLVPASPASLTYVSAEPPAARQMVVLPVAVPLGTSSQRHVRRVPTAVLPANLPAPPAPPKLPMDDVYGVPPVEVEAGSTKVTAANNPDESVEEQIVNCVENALDLILGCRRPPGGKSQ